MDGTQSSSDNKIVPKLKILTQPDSLYRIRYMNDDDHGVLLGKGPNTARSCTFPTLQVSFSGRLMSSLLPHCYLHRPSCILFTKWGEQTRQYPIFQAR